MTCIAGLVHGGHVYMGADSAGVSGWDLSIRADAKLFRRGPYLMGFTDSYRMGQLLRYRLNVDATSGPNQPSHADVVARTDDLHGFMATRFIDDVRACLKTGGYQKTENEVERGGTFLVGVGGRLFRVERDYQVGEPLAGYDAVGSGQAYALGALHALVVAEGEPARKVAAALEAAAAHNIGVRPPFLLEVLRGRHAAGIPGGER